ncbi:hypothetical protein E3O44_04660 [Cryobacterium algoricola]|uniref:Uncharacterized protein n=1 Tax=Cryobacterium algoricola TaxID=1259183 RepID=A0ABY2IH18_9MICO|nr:hypothetical protein [Cryobacterium algoricola]TFB90854.1 hypothetical protein E3O44_04660 [Cryobacterium algoricola]
MDPSVVGVLAATFGSTGLAGALAYGVNFSRVVRLRKSVRESLELASSFEIGSVSRSALNNAAERDAVRLASLSLVQHPTGMRSAILMVLASAGFGAVMLARLRDEAQSAPLSKAVDSLGWQLTGFAIGYVLFMVLALDLMVTSRRDRVVRSILVKGKVELRWNGNVALDQRLFDVRYSAESDAEKKRIAWEIKKSRASRRAAAKRPVPARQVPATELQ